MNPKAKKICVIACCFFSFITARAVEKDSLSVVLDKPILMHGDTLSLSATYLPANKKTITATLQIQVENEKGNSTKMRWPLLNGMVDGEFIIPDSLPNGKYQISFAVQPRFFRIYGQVKPPIRTTMLNTNLLTGKGAWLSAEIPVETDGTFTIKNWLFEKDATLVFSRQKKVNGDLDISINTWLDSAYQPAAYAVREFYVGTPPPSVSVDSTGSRVQPDTSKFNERVNLLPGVVVTGKQKTRAEKFDETYATGLFKSMDEKVFDFMSETSDALGYNSVLDYLQGRVAGLRIERGSDGTMGASWRGGPVSFFIDELRVDADQVTTLSTADIAIVKVFPPPFFGAAGGSGGAIAVYTRRGEYSSNTGNRHVFRIKGYTPLQTVLYLR